MFDWDINWADPGTKQAVTSLGGLAASVLAPYLAGLLAPSALAGVGGVGGAIGAGNTIAGAAAPVAMNAAGAATLGGAGSALGAGTAVGAGLAKELGAGAMQAAPQAASSGGGFLDAVGRFFGPNGVLGPSNLPQSTPPANWAMPDPRAAGLPMPVKSPDPILPQIAAGPAIPANVSNPAVTAPPPVASDLGPSGINTLNPQLLQQPGLVSAGAKPAPASIAPPPAGPQLLTPSVVQARADLANMGNVVGQDFTAANTKLGMANPGITTGQDLAAAQARLGFTNPVSVPGQDFTQAYAELAKARLATPINVPGQDFARALSSDPLLSATGAGRSAHTPIAGQASIPPGFLDTPGLTAKPATAPPYQTPVTSTPIPTATPKSAPVTTTTPPTTSASRTAAQNQLSQASGIQASTGTGILPQAQTPVAQSANSNPFSPSALINPPGHPGAGKTFDSVTDGLMRELTQQALNPQPSWWDQAGAWLARPANQQFLMKFGNNLATKPFAQAVGEAGVSTSQQSAGAEARRRQLMAQLADPNSAVTGMEIRNPANGQVEEKYTGKYDSALSGPTKPMPTLSDPTAGGQSTLNPFSQTDHASVKRDKLRNPFESYPMGERTSEDTMNHYLSTPYWRGYR